MEAEIINPPSNGIEKTVPPISIPPTELQPMKDAKKSIELAFLKDSREKHIQILNNLRSEREGIIQRQKELDISVSRTEGAIITFNNLIAEIDPVAAQQMMGG
jgi:hypothetical protein